MKSKKEEDNMHPQRNLIEAAEQIGLNESGPPPKPYDHEAHTAAFHNAAIDAIKTYGIHAITKQPEIQNDDPPGTRRRTHLQKIRVQEDPLGHYAEKAHRAKMELLTSPPPAEMDAMHGSASDMPPFSNTKAKSIIRAHAAGSLDQEGVHSSITAGMDHITDQVFGMYINKANSNPGHVAEYGMNPEHHMGDFKRAIENVSEHKELPDTPGV